MPSFLFLTATIVALLPAAAAVKDRFVTDLKPNSAVSSCAPTDDPVQCAALVDLYTATNGKQWRDNVGWLSGTSYCGWHGVTCDEDGNVNQLYHLDDNQLAGTIPDSLGNLTSLQGLNLAINQLVGIIPATLCPVISSPGFFCGLFSNNFSCPLPCHTAQKCSATCH